MKSHYAQWLCQGSMCCPVHSKNIFTRLIAICEHLFSGLASRNYVYINKWLPKPTLSHYETPVSVVIWEVKPALTHWGRVTHICVSDVTSIGSDNGLSPGRRQAIIRTNAGILLIRPVGTNFSEFLVEILIFWFKKMRLKVSSAKRRPFCLGLNELNNTEKPLPCNNYLSGFFALSNVYIYIDYE